MAYETEDTLAYSRSLEMVRRCLSPAGFVASPTDVDNYARIWARDGVITGLAALTSGDTDLIAGMERTLSTLRQHQGPHGEIPSNVTVDGSQVSFGRLVGRVDALLWYIIGACAFLRYVSDAQLTAEHLSSVKRALFLAGCWEYNNRGLIYTPLAGNWADEYIQQGYVLSDQLLYLMALQSAGLVFASQAWQAKAEALRQLLVVNYWPRLSLCHNPLVYHPHAYRQQVNQGENMYWLSAFSPGGYVMYFDGLAHALALLTQLGDDEQRQQAEGYVQALEKQIGNALLPAFWPVIHPGEPAWTSLESNHLYEQIKNQPYLYHNGGLWPVLTGLYAVGLVRDGQPERARHLLAAINLANAQGGPDGQWTFTEYHHGQAHVPMGTKYLGWSAAAGVMAHQAAWHGIISLPV
ncbi:MAG TPA: glycoside hydrolase 100 family protein [Ktedonobacteraceae bacterium]|nr:glycoside hydrolase 100 family protein [Ktedonobacteraceae bacterium]